MDMQLIDYKKLNAISNKLENIFIKEKFTSLDIKIVLLNMLDREEDMSEQSCSDILERKRIENTPDKK